MVGGVQKHSIVCLGQVFEFYNNEGRHLAYKIMLK
jgi:hypothetical protein